MQRPFGEPHVVAVCGESTESVGRILISSLALEKAKEELHKRTRQTAKRAVLMNIASLLHRDYYQIMLLIHVKLENFAT